MLCRNHIDVADGVRRCARCGTPFCPDCLVELSGRPYCATCKSEQLLDVRSGVDTTQLQLASNGRRFAALILDSLLVVIPMYTLMAFVAFIPAMQGREPTLMVNFVSIPFALLSIVYEGLMLQYKDGQTLGKMALKVRVVRPDGSSLTPGQCWGRVVMRTVLGCLWIVDYIPAFLTQEKTTLHDMVAGTRVIDN